MNFDSFDGFELRVAVSFCKPKAITKNIAEPDQLEVIFLKPRLIIDAETDERLEIA